MSSVTVQPLNGRGIPLNAKRQACEYQLLKLFGPTREEIKPGSTDYNTDALTNKERTNTPEGGRKQWKKYKVSRKVKNFF